MNLILTNSIEKQKTIKKKFVFNGISLFSGKKISMTCEPCPENTGIIFYYNNVSIPAVAENIKTMDIHTTALSKNGVDILSIEHLMSAVWGLGIDNLKIILNSNVVPAKDGSAKPYIKAFLKVGIVNQKKFRRILIFEKPEIFTQPEFANRFAKFQPNDNLEIKCSVPFPKPIGKHIIIYSDNSKEFIDDISWARTFLRSSIDLNDLTKWNSIRSIFKALPKDPHKSPIITFTEKEFLTPLKKIDEPARHKLLDLIGDLALIGYRIHTKISINEPGHKFTHLIAKKIRENVHSNS